MGQQPAFLQCVFTSSFLYAIANLGSYRWIQEGSAASIQRRGTVCGCPRHQSQRRISEPIHNFKKYRCLMYTRAHFRYSACQGLSIRVKFPTSSRCTALADSRLPRRFWWRLDSEFPSFLPLALCSSLVEHRTCTTSTFGLMVYLQHSTSTAIRTVGTHRASSSSVVDQEYLPPCHPDRHHRHQRHRRSLPRW